MEPGTFSFRLNVLVRPSKTEARTVKIPIDVVIQPKNSKLPHLPLLIEAKSAGDFTNVNKRRKEEATKINQIRATYGKQITFVLFLCGYFDAAYLGYEAAEGIDWIWEHRTEDLDQLGL
jgi:type II restriction enzyme